MAMPKPARPPVASLKRTRHRRRDEPVAASVNFTKKGEEVVPPR